MTSMYSKVIFILDWAFTERDYNRFSIDLFKKNNIEVEVWDISLLLNPQYKKVWESTKKFEFTGLKIVLSKEKFNLECSLLTTECMAFPLFGYSLKTIFLWKILSRYKTPYSLILFNAIPTPSQNKRILNISKGKITETVKQWLMFINSIPSATYCFLGGTSSLAKHLLVNSTTKPVWCHTLDYDLYLDKVKGHGSNENENYAVFLDEYLPFHQDYLIHQVATPSDPDIYFTKLNTFFDLVELKLGLKVIIAAHPSSFYEQHPDYFCGRKVVKYKTIDLVKSSQLVLAHGSTSLNFAVLFEKPVLMLTTSEIQQSFLQKNINAFNNWIDCPLITIETATELNFKPEDLKINHSAYQMYKEHFIKQSGSDNIPAFQIVINTLLEY